MVQVIENVEGQRLFGPGNSLQNDKKRPEFVARWLKMIFLPTSLPTFDEGTV